MARLDRDSDTICALATPSGVGALSVIRISGERAVQIIRNIAQFLPNDLISHRAYYGFLRDLNSDEVIDEVILTYFEKGKSFSGEESIEISCHGGHIITQQILRVLISLGTRIAQKGEFTYRAFINGRIDLPQAEAVLSVIESQTTAGAKLALRQLQGGFSASLKSIEDELVWSLSRLEANIDFSSEFIEFASQNEIILRVEKALNDTQKLLKTYNKGRILKSGLKVVLAGPPNVGKSSILNRLSKQDRAIVSSTPGTTRDTIEIEIEIDGNKVLLIDTAGIHETEEQIELQGVERALKEQEAADIILSIHDVTNPGEKIEKFATEKSAQNIIYVGNKSDLNHDKEKQTADIFLSASTGEGIEELFEKIKIFFNLQNEETSAVLLNARHYELLLKTEIHLSSGLKLLKGSMSPEFVISELQESFYAILEILGRRFDDDILDRIFSDFCLGK
ncbi:MAG: tRNA uridine-5-carboxymethylaminomethyl(34) synthesis GTPase MnmE [Bdellovibrionales bacterium RBG_16_40_8]|nr:MAG: tRNA uridine-5-carboxymethylaminomethyl(34) synthesis GTPase MnmE [Bdellovibrionales bacterium RBG_16_40_8]